MAKSATYFLSFSLTIFLSAFLLFQVQPIISKYILPWFGGSFSVWTTSMLFFQVLLLIGYLYAYLLTKLQLKLQILIHIAFLTIIAVIVLVLMFFWGSPITPPLYLKPGENIPPVMQVIILLTLSVGLPYFMLSTTSSLLQRWFSQLGKGYSPYRLYALSNAGSLIGILSYPFLIEIFIPIRWQGIFWAVGFILYAIFLFYCSRLAVRHSKKNLVNPSLNISVKISESKKVALWIFLPLLSSLLLLATTNKVTQAIAPVPFLWLIPLGLYLFSFILCFESERWYWRKFYPHLLIFSAIGAVVITTIDFPAILINFIIYCLFLFSSFMLLHGEVYRVRPSPEKLNLYYLCISFGGALGGVLVGVVAPLIFNNYWEYFIGIFLVYCIALFVIVTQWRPLIGELNLKYYISKVPKLFYLLILCSILLIGIEEFATDVEQDKNIQVRNFYGVAGVTEWTDNHGNYRVLYNGEINHGGQYLEESLKDKPTTYFSEKSGVGIAILNHQKRLSSRKNLNIGIVGLGVGIIATYGREGDEITFYELNPVVTVMANRYFTFLKDSKAKVNVIHGDARLSMEKEVGKKKYDMLVIDAFSDDAIPTHLLTKEAFLIYLKLLEEENGILAIHISNKYLDLRGVVEKMAQHYNLKIAVIESEFGDYQTNAARWILMSKNPNALSAEEIQKVKSEEKQYKDFALWTDDYSNLFQVLRF